MTIQKIREALEAKGLSAQDILDVLAAIWSEPVPAYVMTDKPTSKTDASETPEERSKRLARERQKRYKASRTGNAESRSDDVIAVSPPIVVEERETSNSPANAGVSVGDVANREGVTLSGAADVSADVTGALPGFEPLARVVISSLPSEEVIINPLSTTLIDPPKAKRTRMPRNGFPRSTRCPEDWGPKDRHRELVLELGMHPRTAQLELAKFRDFEFKSPGNSDWDAAFRNWLRNAAQRNGGRHVGPATINSQRQQRDDAMLAGFMAAAHREG